MLKAPPQRFRPRLVTAAPPYKATELGNPGHRLGQRGGLLWLSAVGFLRVIIMLVFLPSYMSLSLLPPETSRGLGQRQPRQGWGRLLRHRDRCPGFRDEAARGQRGVVEQRHQDQVPAPAKDTDQPQAGGTPRPRLPGDQGRDGRGGGGRGR